MARIDRVLIKQVQGPDGPEVRFQVNEAKERKGEGWEEAVAKLITDELAPGGFQRLEFALDGDDQSILFTRMFPNGASINPMWGMTAKVAGLLISMCLEDQRIIKGNDCSVAKAG